MLVSLGLDFRRACLEVRERFHLDDGDVPRVVAALAARGVRETVVTRTCNRVEAYCWWPAAAAGAGGEEAAREICRAWLGGHGPEAEGLRANARLRTGADVALHLFRVAAGLESQILGDIHILGQLRRAFRDSVQAKAIGPHLHRLFETALRVGKQVKRETRLLATRNSVGSEAARMAAQRVGGLAGRACVVVGCGKSGTHAARALADLGATDLAVVNRTVERAEQLARELGQARAAGLDALPTLLARADLVIVATGAPKPVLTAEALRAARSAAGERRLLVVDVSVPRNVESSARSLPALELVDLDTLHPEAAEIERSRLEAVPEAEALVLAGVDEFVRWLELHTARRALGPLHELLSAICRREVAYLAGNSPLADRAADRIVAGIMARPMAVLRAASERGERVEETAGALGALFAAQRPPTAASGRAGAQQTALHRDGGATLARTDAFSRHESLGTGGSLP
jgi:glutamyl-tRNA reductase